MPETYRLIAETETDAEAPITADLMKALQKNLIACFEGAVGAPKLQGKSVARDFNGGLEVITVAAGTVDSDQGEGFKNGATVFTSSSSSTNVLGAQYVIQSYTGTLRFRCAIAGGASPARTCTADLFKNGVLVSSVSNGGTTTVFSIDSTVAPGDVFEWRFRSNVGGLSVTFGPRVPQADDPYVQQPTYRRNSEIFL